MDEFKGLDWVTKTDWVCHPVLTGDEGEPPLTAKDLFNLHSINESNFLFVLGFTSGIAGRQNNTTHDPPTLLHLQAFI